MGLNEDLQISSEEKRRGYGGVVLDDSNFHESANLELFDKERIISINAPDGEVRIDMVQGCRALHVRVLLGSNTSLSPPPPPQRHTHPTHSSPYSLKINDLFSFSLSLQFTLMNYRVTGDFINSIPFRVYTTVEDGDIPKLVMNKFIIIFFVPNFENVFST